MNKLVAFVLGLALILAAVQPAIAETVDLTGTWVLERILIGGLELSPLAFGVSGALELKEDGNFVLSATVLDSETTGADTEDVIGSWALEENTLVLTSREDGAAITGCYSPEDRRLSITDEMFTMVMARESEAVLLAPAAQPVPVAAESEEAFFGTWRVCATDFNGIYIPIPDSDGNETLILDSGTCTMIYKDPYTGESRERPLTTRFQDGGLGLYNYEYSYDKTTPGTLRLMDDGTLCLFTEYEYTYYYSKVD